jgi:hypothetical protein
MAKILKLKLPPKESGKENLAPKGSASAVKSAPRKNAIWSATDDKTLVDVLTEQQAAGNQADNNWKGVVWVAAALKLKGSEAISGGGPKTADGCDNHWQKVCPGSYLSYPHILTLPCASAAQKGLLHRQGAL